MIIILLAILWPIFAVIAFLLGFMIGRCGRKLPILDSKLPWTLHWGENAPDDPEPTAADEIHPRPPWSGHRPSGRQ